MVASTDEVWEIFWTYHGWFALYERLNKELPKWAKMRMVDPKQPLESQVANAKVLVPTTGQVPAEVINAAKELKIIVQPAAGYNNIAIEAAQARGIPVCTCPGVNAASVAEGALMMMLMLARRVHEQEQTFRQGEIGHPYGMQLCGKTLGIIGLGAIGNRLAKTAEAIGMHVIGLNSKSTAAQLASLLQQADIVSVHCPLTPNTHHLLGRAELQMMKKGSFLINYARGDVVDKQALTDALLSGHLGGAGLDVHWVEPADPSDPIYKHPNVIATPHTGVSTIDVYDELFSIVSQNIIRQHDGGELLHRLV